MLPRPHVVQVEPTFVNGPRKLEGIQEFFLTVIRPESIEDVVVEAYLETAHVANVPITEYDRRTDTASLYVTAPCTDTGGSLGDDSSTETRSGTETYIPPPDWEIDVDRDGGYRIVEPVDGKRVDDKGVRDVTLDSLTLHGEVSTRFIDGWNNRCDKGHLDMEVEVYLRRTESEIVGYDKSLWLTGRGLCCGKSPEYVVEPGDLVWEVDLEADFEAAVGRSDVIGLEESNVLLADISENLYRSVDHPDRHEPGTVRLQDAHFVARSIAETVRVDNHLDDVTVDAFGGVDPDVREKVTELASNVSRGRILEAPLQELQDRLDLSVEQAVHLNRAALGLEVDLPPRKDRWEPPAKRESVEVVVPDIVGLPLTEARERVTGADLHVDDLTYQDSEQPADTVLNQYPDADKTVESGSYVDLVVATGLSVRIPDLIGERLTNAFGLLSEAGLESEPSVTYAESGEHPAGHVLEVTPAERTYVTPNASVALQVAGDPNSDAEYTTTGGVADEE